MRVKLKKLHLKQRQQRFNQKKRKQQQERLSLQRRRLMLKEGWLSLRRRVNRWLQTEVPVGENTPGVEIYQVKGRILRERETKVSSR